MKRQVIKTPARCPQCTSVAVCAELSEKVIRFHCQPSCANGGACEWDLEVYVDPEATSIVITSEGTA